MWTKDTHLYSRTTWAEVNATKCAAFIPLKPEQPKPRCESDQLDLQEELAALRNPANFPKA